MRQDNKRKRKSGDGKQDKKSKGKDGKPKTEDSGKRKGHKEETEEEKQKRENKEIERKGKEIIRKTCTAANKAGPELAMFTDPLSFGQTLIMCCQTIQFTSRDCLV